MRRYWRRHGLSTTLLALFAISWALQAWSQYREAQESGEPFLWHFVATTAENWQSEFLQVFTIVMLTKWLMEIGSHESKQPGDEEG